MREKLTGSFDKTQVTGEVTLLLHNFTDGKELTDDEAHALTDTLTLHQAAVVKRRIDSLNSTLRKKQKQNAKTDVRDIFPAGPIQQQQSPRSPDSPLTGDHINNGFYSGPQRSSKIRDKGVVFPKKGGYSMSGKRSEVVQDTSDSDNSSINQGLTSISDEDILCEFKEVEDSSSHFKDLKNFTLVHDKLENGLFGVPLQSLLEHDQRVKPDIEVPMVFVDIINFLEKYCLTSEGLLRVPGSATRVKQLRSELEEKFYSGTFSWVDVVPNDAAALMKQFLRELPIPLLTHDYIEAFAQVENIQDKKLQLQALNLLVILLPDVHRATLKLLLSFLNKVVNHSDINRMGLSNIAMIMAPNLFLSPSNRSKSKGIKDIEITMAAGTSNGDFQEGVIRIQAPNLTKSCTAVQLDEFTTAGQIVDRFRNNYVSETRMKTFPSREKLHEHSSVFNDPAKVNFAQENTHLYEVGGNIGERCLDHKTRMMSLYRGNKCFRIFVYILDCVVFMFHKKFIHNLRIILDLCLHFIMKKVTFQYEKVTFQYEKVTFQYEKLHVNMKSYISLWKSYISL
ncbi:hypothetical protein KUTeg_000586 [Tegillarca granosa]|uniref:Rho-GAP domain-containing protein n=1 Tax=Tegillarca granosa TaxID=220873 RepID=A0ABQ9FY16_TEGGR|nr:hypothetical protein KUTeg_000586 [Tegillarca granosa]